MSQEGQGFKGGVGGEAADELNKFFLTNIQIDELSMFLFIKQTDR